jgi:hypothetical protein
MLLGLRHFGTLSFDDCDHCVLPPMRRRLSPASHRERLLHTLQCSKPAYISVLEQYSVDHTKRHDVERSGLSCEVANLPIGVSDFVNPGYAAHVVVLVGSAAIRLKSSRRPGAWKAEMALADGDAEARELSAYKG